MHKGSSFIDFIKHLIDVKNEHKEVYGSEDKVGLPKMDFSTKKSTKRWMSQTIIIFKRNKMELTDLFNPLELTYLLSAVNMKVGHVDNVHYKAYREIRKENSLIYNDFKSKNLTIHTARDLSFADPDDLKIVEFNSKGRAHGDIRLNDKKKIRSLNMLVSLITAIIFTLFVTYSEPSAEELATLRNLLPIVPFTILSYLFFKKY